MTDRARVALWRGLAATGAGLAVAGAVGAISLAAVDFWIGQGGLLLVVFTAFFAALVWVVIRRQPTNALLAVLAICTFLFGAFSFGAGWLAALTDPLVLYDGITSPADLEPVTAWVAAYNDIGWIPPMMFLLSLGLLLFPDGKLPSPRWRYLAIYSIVIVSFATVTGLLDNRPSSTRPLFRDMTDESVVVVSATLLAVALSLLSLLLRVARTQGEERQQFRWVLWGAACLILTLVIALVFEGSAFQPVSDAGLYLGGGALVASYGIAVGRYRLYDIDLVISRTFVYGALAAFITGVYVAAVLGIGGLLGGDAQSSPWLAIGATALVAFAFEPLRGRLQRLANRLVYGKRATPYEVLSDFSQRIGADDEELLGQVARSLVDGTTGVEASVWVMLDGSLTRVAAWPFEAAQAAGQEGPPEEATVMPVIHDGETLGVLALLPGRGQGVAASDKRLLEQVASGLGLALRNLRLSAELRRQVEELRRSRQRLLAVQDEARRQLESELHERAQQRLVALKVKLELAQRRALADGQAEVADLLQTVTADTVRTVDSLRDFARGVYPPLLREEGLRAALNAQAQKLPLPVSVHGVGVGRMTAEVEAAAYFSVLEGLQNVVKHANADSAHVHLIQTDSELVFEVSDDGEGFDPASVAVGSGLGNLADRLDALDGTIEVISRPGEGTTLKGTIPLRVREAVS